ncbi:phosphatase PAP2 family protein [Georgenia muralis]
MPEPTPRTSEETIGTRDVTSWRSMLGRGLVALVAWVARRLPEPLHRAGRWSAANLAFVVLVAVAGAAMVGLTAVTHTVQENVADEDGISVLDQPVLDAAVDLRTPDLNTAVTAFTDIGGPVGMPVLAGSAVAVLVAVHRRWTPVVLALVAGAGSLAMTMVGKGWVRRIRPPAELAVPPLETSPSFPSGHTLNATVLTVVIVYLVLLRTTATWQRVLAVMVGLLFVVAMGLSRVFLGHHWLTDVVAGWSLGLAWALAVITAHRLWLTLRRREPAPGA